MTHKKIFLGNKFLIVAFLSLVFLGVTQVSAANDHSNNSQKENHSAGNREESQEYNVGSVTPTALPTVTVTPAASTEECNNDSENHGAFVSCIAHEHEDPDTVSDAARSEVGKKNDDIKNDNGSTVTPTVFPTVTPTVSPSIYPTQTPSVTPTGTIAPSPTQTPSITPTVSSEPEKNTSANGVSSLIKALQGLIHALSSAFHI